MLLRLNHCLGSEPVLESYTSYYVVSINYGRGLLSDKMTLMSDMILDLKIKESSR